MDDDDNDEDGRGEEYNSTTRPPQCVLQRQARTERHH